MTKKEAISVFTQVCEAYKGTLKEHEILQTALQVINRLVEPDAKPVDKQPDTKQ